MEKLLTVVIPIYKVEQYIRKCLDSLLVPQDQLGLLDIIVINDGTPDRSAEIAKEYERKYPGVFRVIDKENGGHGSAWNKGTELAVGKYLSYLDSDDWYDTDQFSMLIGFLQKYDVDMVLMDSTKYYAYQNKEVIVALKNMNPGVVYDALIFDWLHSGNGANITYVPNTVYRTAMMQKYHPIFCEHVMYDDIILQVLPIISSRSFVYSNLNVYHYLIGRPGQSFDPAIRAKRASDVTTVLKQVLAFIRNHREEVPTGTTSRAWADNLYSSFATHHYQELSRFPYSISKERLSNWDSFIKESYPDIELTKLVRLYRSLPFPIYYSWFKVDFLFGKVKKRLLKSS